MLQVTALCRRIFVVGSGRATLLLLVSSLVYSGSWVQLAMRHGFRRSIWHLRIRERISSQSIVGAVWFQSVLVRALAATWTTQKRGRAGITLRVQVAAVQVISRRASHDLYPIRIINNEIVEETLPNIRYAHFCVSEDALVGALLCSISCPRPFKLRRLYPFS